MLFSTEATGGTMRLTALVVSRSLIVCLCTLLLLGVAAYGWSLGEKDGKASRNLKLAADTKLLESRTALTANERFIEKLHAAFLHDVPGFSDLPENDRYDFLRITTASAEAKGLRTEQGIASYALAVWWLGIDFVARSKELESLLKGSYPEARKVRAMNEWVNSMIGDPDNVAAADEKLKDELAQTETRGR
jgi:hypothetical protein